MIVNKRKASVPLNPRRVRKYQRRAKKGTPFADTGAIIGNKIGGIFGVSKLGKIGGRLLGSGIGNVLFGSGAYDSNLQLMENNSIINSQLTPALASGGPSSQDSVVFRKSEFIQDIVSNAVANTITTNTFSINPGQVTTFPFLAAIAANFEEYRMRGMVFHFKSLSGDSVASVQSGLGFVAIATQYDALDTTFTTKASIENYSMSQSGKPSLDKLHGVECAAHMNALSHLYVRPTTQPANTDLRLYDLGKTTVMTSCPGTSVTLGELWVTYDVELFKPKIADAAAAVVTPSAHITRKRVTVVTIDFGTDAVQAVGQLAAGTTVSATSLAFTGLVASTKYLLSVTQNSATAISTMPSYAVTVGTIGTLWCDSTGVIDVNQFIIAPSVTAGAGGTRSMYNTVITSTAGGLITVTCTAGSYTGAANSGTEIWLTAVDATVLT